MLREHLEPLGFFLVLSFESYTLILFPALTSFRNLMSGPASSGSKLSLSLFLLPISNVVLLIIFLLMAPRKKYLRKKSLRSKVLKVVKNRD